jgi:hypothetical protein
MTRTKGNKQEVLTLLLEGKSTYMYNYLKGHNALSAHDNYPNKET